MTAVDTKDEAEIIEKEAEEIKEEITEEIAEEAADEAEELTSVEEESEEEAPAEEADDDKKKKKKKRYKIHEITEENDIKYRGPLSYRHFKILAWLFIIFSQIGVIAGLFKKAEIKFPVSQGVLDFLSFFASLGLPMLLVSTFTILINGRDSYKRMLIVNGSITAGFFLLFVLVYERYILGILSVLPGTENDSAEAARQLLTNKGLGLGYFTFNIFLDVFLCTLVVFFINYQPKKYFQGKNLKYFRMLVLIPIAYEIGSLVIKILASEEVIKIPVIFSPLLPTKSPTVFFLFMTLAIYLKRREMHFIEKGKTQEEYQKFLQTNTNSWQFTKYFIKILIIIALIDIGLMFVFTAIFFATSSTTDIDQASDVAYNWGFGKTVDLIGLIPFMLLYSYTRLHKNKLIDILIPLLGVIVIALIYLDSIFITLCEFIEKGKSMFEM